MSIRELLKEGRTIWKKKMDLDHVVSAMGTVYGDICRYTRDKKEGKAVDPGELKKELGNVIFSTIRWCEDLGYSPEECIHLAKDAQKAYIEKISED